MPNAVIFGDGKCGPRTKKYKSAMSLAELLSSMGYNIVNGGYGGVMEASARGASKYPVERIGIVIENYYRKPNRYLTRMVYVPSYLNRLKLLIDMGDLYFFFEGGSGTLLEFMALIALYERGIIEKHTFCFGGKWMKFLNFLYNTFNLSNNVLNYLHYFKNFEVKDELIKELVRWSEFRDK